MKERMLKHERLKKAKNILPVRFDDTEIPGVLNTTGYIDARSLLPSQLANLILAKLDIIISAKIEQTTVKISRKHVSWIWGFRGPPIPIPISSLDRAPVKIFIDDVAFSSVYGGESRIIELDLGVHYIHATSRVEDFISGPMGTGGSRIYNLKSEPIGKKMDINKIYSFEITLQPDRFNPGCTLIIQEVSNLANI